MSDQKMRYCAYCGDELGVYGRAHWQPGDTCGKRDCERYARDAEQAECEEAHEQLDRDMGWR